MAVAGFDQAMQGLADSSRRYQADVDETRRLLYMELVAPKCKRYNLAGTLINTLRHHHGIDSPGLEDRIINLVNGDGVSEDAEGEEAWVRKQIAQLSGTEA
jgi:hypothetical protein